LHKSINNNKRVLLWGNSHADQYSGLFKQISILSNSSFYLNARNCRATPDHDFCGNSVQESILKYIILENITDVVLSSTGYGSYGVRDSEYEKNLNYIVNQLSIKGVRVWLVIDIPVAKELSPIESFNKNPVSPVLGSILLSKYLITKNREINFFNDLAHKHERVYVVDPSIELCDFTYCYAGKGEQVWYRDEGHLTDAGAKAMAAQFRPIFFND
jgi:hypothetical protein